MGTHGNAAVIGVTASPVTESNGWKRTVKVAVTCHCMEVSATSALPAVSEIIGAYYNQE